MAAGSSASKEKYVAGNRAILDTVPVFPGAKRIPVILGLDGWTWSSGPSRPDDPSVLAIQVEPIFAF